MNMLVEVREGAAFTNGDVMLLNTSRVLLAVDGNITFADTTRVVFDVKDDSSETQQDAYIKVAFADYQKAVGFCDLTP